MTEAVAMAAAGAPHGTAVFADEQTAGVGRLGRSWESDRDMGIYCSVLLRLALPASGAPVVTLALGLATAEAIERSCSVACDLRWPNDVLVDERKVAGILAQLADGCVIAGIGINVNQTEMPDGLRTPATSLRIACGGRIQTRETLAIHLLAALDDFCGMLVEQGPERILKAFIAASSYAFNRRVVYETNGETRRGITAGLDSQGFLLVRDDSGAVETVHTGGVRPDIS